MPSRPSPERLERQAIGATIWQLSLVSGIHAGTLSLAERGLTQLTEEQEDRRQRALRKLERGGRVAVRVEASAQPRGRR